MITETQKVKIQDLITSCKDDKLKAIIESAFQKWLSGKVNPRQHNYGVWGSVGEWESFEGECCLIGAALIDKPRLIAPYEDALHYFKVEPAELDSYIFGFDGRESNETVTELRKILFGH